MTYIILVLVLFQVKHWVIDFIFQTDEMVHGKGIYGNFNGIEHSLQHAIGTFFIGLAIAPSVAVLIAFIDFITHYHIDYCKMKFGNRDIKTKAFWVHLGLDQMAHQLTYIGLLAIMIASTI